MENKNKPYVKIFKNGVLQNPIEKHYISGASKRKIKRGLERFNFIESLNIIKHQFKSKRGIWYTRNVINLNN